MDKITDPIPLSTKVLINLTQNIWKRCVDVRRFLVDEGRGPQTAYERMMESAFDRTSATIVEIEDFYTRRRRWDTNEQSRFSAVVDCINTIRATAPGLDEDSYRVLLEDQVRRPWTPRDTQWGPWGPEHSL